ncbi:MAG: pseudouridylate synthase [Chitinophagaceae bacterium]|nr:MAG: pseudouridylate synthase [Chitinophagaceae bacterium]
MAAGVDIPDSFSLMGGHNPHPACLLAADDLQSRLASLGIHHNFGLTISNDINAAGGSMPAVADLPVIGKMFGVLVVRSPVGECGYLSAFSGKMAGGNHHAGFVPPVFDSLTENSFLNVGMRELTAINDAIRQLEIDGGTVLKENKLELAGLRLKRRQHSTSLQQQLFDHYHFLNRKGDSKSLNTIFSEAGYRNAPSGAGECAGPKLLQFAFLHGYEPLALTEFWWGKSPKSATWKHQHFYACCKEKCEPILGFMLS